MRFGTSEGAPGRTSLRYIFGGRGMTPNVEPTGVRRASLRTSVCGAKLGNRESLDDAVRTQQNRLRDRDAEHLGGFQVYDSREDTRQFDRQIRGTRAFENLGYISGCTRREHGDRRPHRNQRAVARVVLVGRRDGNTRGRGKAEYTLAHFGIGGDLRIVRTEQPINALRGSLGKCDVDIGKADGFEANERHARI